MKRFLRSLAILQMAIFCVCAFANSTPTKLPFTVNLAPGDVLMHGSDRQENTGQTYQQVTMQAGDKVFGTGGKMRSVILPGDATAVEVLNGSTLTAREGARQPMLELENGVTRVGRASYGDGSPIRMGIKTRNVEAVIHGGDLLVSKSGEGSATVAMPEPDGRYLYGGRVSLHGGGDASGRTYRPEPTFTYSDAKTETDHNYTWRPRTVTKTVRMEETMKVRFFRNPNRHVHFTRVLVTAKGHPRGTVITYMINARTGNIISSHRHGKHHRYHRSHHQMSHQGHAYEFTAPHMTINSHRVN